MNKCVDCQHSRTSWLTKALLCKRPHTQTGESRNRGHCTLVRMDLGKYSCGRAGKYFKAKEQHE